MVDDRAEIEAVGWRLRMPDMGDGDWDAFTRWLEADPDNARAYDSVAQLDDELPVILHTVEAGRTNGLVEVVMEAPKRHARFWGIAAAFVALIGGGIGYRSLKTGTDSYPVATAAGENRSIRLADGTTIALNGDTRLLLSHSDPRSVRLDRGEAAFRVTHNPANPFEVIAGTTTLQDVGTYFNVSRLDDGLEVAVAEGAVAYDPAGSNVLLRAGQSARLAGHPASLEIREVNPAWVASWRAKKLIFRAAPLERVAIDIGRAIGKRMQVDPSLRSQMFTGVLMMQGSGDDIKTRIEGLLGVDVVIAESSWRLRPPSRAPR